MSTLGTANAGNHSACDADPAGGGPVGVGGTIELCVVVSETPGGASMFFRGPSPLDIPMAPGAAITIGDYDVDITVTFVPGLTGHALTTDAIVTRTTAGTGGIMVWADGGLGPALGLLPIPSIALHLEGMSTGTSRTEQGGGLGYVATPAQDLNFVGIRRTIVENTLEGISTFDSVEVAQEFVAGAVAVTSITAFHINKVGVITTVPGGVTAGNPTLPHLIGLGGMRFEPHFECYSVNNYTKLENTVVTLEDQFDGVKVRLGDIKRICTPVSKNGEKIPDPDLHLVCYEIKKGHDAKQPVLATNQFGKAKMNVRHARELCVPSTKELLEK